MSNEKAEMAEQSEEQIRLLADEMPQENGVTEAKSSQAVFHLPGGYLDPSGELHTAAEVRETGGQDEDLLGQESVPMIRRLGTIMARCTERVGLISGTANVQRAVWSLPVADRIALLIFVRRVTHGDAYDMELTCPYGPQRGGKCGKPDFYTQDLSELEFYTMPEPRKRVYELVGPRSKRKFKWTVATGKFEEVLSRVAQLSEHEIMTYTQMTRLLEVDGRDVALNPEDILDAANNKIKLSARGKALYDIVRGMGSSDRDALRSDFYEKEPGVDTDIEVECKHCRREFSAVLDVMQPGFFFPSVIRKRSKMR
jgi:hypothetical protein